MENTLQLTLDVGEDAPGKLSELAEDANMKESTRPTLATTIAALVRLRQLAQAAGSRLPAYVDGNDGNVGANAKRPNR